MITEFSVQIPAMTSACVGRVVLGVSHKATSGGTDHVAADFFDVRFADLQPCYARHT